MELWNSIVDWFGSENGQRVVFGAIIPFVAILVAGLIGAAIGRGATRRVVAQRERETRASAVAALISVGHTAARWHSQPPAVREHHEALASAADIQVRLLPLSGAHLAADWAAHELADMRTNSVSFSFQAEQSLTEYRDRLVEWLHKPGRAKKLFAADLERWRFETPEQVDPVVLEQQRWAQQQLSEPPAQRHESAPTETPQPASAQPASPQSAAARPTEVRPAAAQAAAEATTEVQRLDDAQPATVAMPVSAAAPNDADAPQPAGR